MVRENLFYGLPTSAENFFHLIYLLFCLVIKNQHMRRTYTSFILLLALAFFGATASPCPSANYQGSVFSTKIVAALDGGIIPFNNAQDTQCYNYSLPYSFARIPSVAVSVHEFEAEPSNGLYFFIKPIHSESLSFVPIVVRTQWSYTQWTQITFSFLAEDRDDIESGYFQIDSGYLSSCESEKSISAVLPFRNTYSRGNLIQHNVFLHGFEIASVRNHDGSQTPFELQIIETTSNSNGISVTFSVTTATQVNSIYVSFVAFQQTNLQIIGGGFVYDVTEKNNGLYFAPETNIPRNFARLYGLTGFLLNHNTQSIRHTTKWDGFTFSFTFGQQESLKYFSFSYLFFTGSVCLDCAGFQIQLNGACVSSCPVGTYLTTENTCIDCGTGKQWNGTACIVTCSKGQYLNPATGLCECPPTLNWNGESCVPCLSGKIWSRETKSCECPRPLSWNGYACAKVDPCLGGKVWDVFTFSCQCPDTTFWNGEQCKSLPQCRGGQAINQNYECVCPEGYVWSQDLCIYSPCFGGQIWTGSQCACPAGLNYNGKMCVECINGQKWDAKLGSCSCESGYKWNSQFCEKSYICSNGRIWNPTYQQCMCPDGTYWSGYACLLIQKCTGGQYFDSSLSKCACLSGFQWDGRICVQCTNGRVWNVTTISCTCPPGTVETKTGCRLQQTCTGGKQWVQNSWSCECPSNSIWNGNFCIANACLNGQVWNETLKLCACPNNKAFINQACVPVQIACTNGRVWNQYVYACACPPNTFPTPTSCQSIPVCSFGKIYNPLNNKCQCPYGLSEKNDVCVDPKCPSGQYYNFGCKVINCPPPSYFNKDKCVHSETTNKCGFGYSWNGKECSYSPNSCPSGTTWSGFTCRNTGSCGDGYYYDNGNCASLPQQCPPSYKWDGSRCSSQASLCPKGTYSQGSSCFPYQPCKNGFVWDSSYLRCVCPPGTINNGNRCLECNNDQKWIPGVGCSCPEGSFDTGAACETPDPNKCKVISNAIWSNNKCVCRPGFTKVGLQCVCYGTQNGDLCDKCSYKPNSVFVERSNTCQCRDGYTEISEFCVLKGQIVINDDPSRCAVGTFFHPDHKACLACPNGCLSCSDCYKCQVCRPQFIFDPATEKCVELCGDGKRFSLECDDGNNEDGDGCSRDCRIEVGYTCSGGGQENSDSCYVFKPEKIQIEQIGQIRKSSSLVINVKLNYLPNSLIQAQECANKCNQILSASIIQGDKSAISITSEYLAGTKYIFTVVVEFGKPYIAKFKLNVGVNSLVSKYFGGAAVQPLDISVQPSYLMAVNQKDIA